MYGNKAVNHGKEENIQPVTGHQYCTIKMCITYSRCVAHTHKKAELRTHVIVSKTWLLCINTKRCSQYYHVHDCFFVVGVRLGAPDGRATTSVNKVRNEPL